ncbi:MAG: Fic family protein [Prevotella sp.]
MNPALKKGFLTVLYPDKPNYPGQKYFLTAEGLALYNEKIKMR